MIDKMRIILADDDDGHAELVRRNLVRAGVLNEIIRANDGQAVLDLIRGEGEHAAGGSLEEGFILLLDLNMPKIHGYEVLTQLKLDSRFRHWPIIVLTTTDEPSEIRRCYELGCSIYMTKPVTAEAFIEAIRRLGMFLQVIRAPEA